MRARSSLLLAAAVALALVAVLLWTGDEPPPAPATGASARAEEQPDSGTAARPDLARSAASEKATEEPPPPAVGTLLRLRGRVTDARTGAAVPEARVAAFGDSARRTELRGAEPVAETRSDSGGGFELELVAAEPPYRYVTATAAGYLTGARLLHDGLLDGERLARGFDFALIPESEAATVRGRVLDPAGVALPAVVSLLDQKGRWSAWRETRGSELQTRCDARGAFVLSGATPGHHLLTVRCEGHRPWTKNLELLPASDTDLGVITLSLLAEGEPGATFVGSVTGPDGAPVADAEVAVREKSRREHVTRTDGQGRFEKAVPAGEHGVELRAADRPYVRLQLEFPAGEVLHWHYRYPEGRHFLGGLVVAVGDGKPLPGISAEVRLPGNGGDPDLHLSGTTEQDGRFRIEGIPDGAASLLLEWENPYADLFVAGIALDRDDHRFSFPFPETVRVHGTVHDERGSPLAGALVATDGSDAREARTLSAADGSYSIEVPMTSQQSQRFHAEKSGYLAVTTHYLREHGGVDAEIVWDPVLIGNDELGTVRGKITGARGQPLAGVRVGIFPHDGGRTVARAFVESDNDGEYRQTDVRPGRLELQFQADGHHELRVSAELDPRGILRRDVALEPVVAGDVQYVLVDEDGVAVSGVVWHAWSYHPRRSHEGVTGDDGRIVLPDWPLATGRIDLETPEGMPGHLVWLERRERAPLPQRLVLRRGDLQVRGRVLDARGRPALRVGVILSDERRDGVQVREYAYTDADGRFTFEHLAPGEYLCEVDSYAQSNAMARAGGPPVELQRSW